MFLRVQLDGRWCELRHVSPTSYTVVDPALPIVEGQEALRALLAATNQAE